MRAQSLQTFPLDSLNPNSLKIKAVWISDDLYLKFDYVSNETKLLLPYKSKILKKLAKQNI